MAKNIGQLVTQDDYELLYRYLNELYGAEQSQTIYGGGMALPISLGGNPCPFSVAISYKTLSGLSRITLHGNLRRCILKFGARWNA